MEENTTAKGHLSQTGTVDPISAVSGASITDIGLRREENQDSYGQVERESFKLYIVADGMGGVKGGAIASKLAIETVVHAISKLTTIDEDALTDSITEANRKIFDASVSTPGLTGMGTTLVALGFVGTDLYIANVGDSRAYRLRNDTPTQLTEDHTLVMELLRSGTISPEQAENHPVSHMLTRSLGPSPEIEVDCWRSFEAPHPGDRYLLCSDGLYNLVSEQEMYEAVRAHPIDEALKKLVDLANERGGSDNITITVVTIADNYPVVEADEPRSIPVAVSLAEKDDADVAVMMSRARSEKEREQAQELKKEEVAVSPSLAAAAKIQAPAQHSIEDAPTAAPIASTNKQAGKSEEEQDVAAPTTASDSVPSQNDMKRTLLFWGERNRTLVMVFIAALFGGIGGAFFFGDSDEPRVQQPEKVAVTESKSIDSLVADFVKRGEKGGVDAAPSTEAPAQAVKAATEDLTLVQNEQGAAPVIKGQDVGLPALPDLSSAQLSRIIRRRDGLQAKIASLSAKLESFDRPFSGNVGKVLTDAEAEIEKNQKALDEIKLDVDKATRKLAVWYQRKKQIREMDPLSFAAPVALISEDVRLKNEAFKEVTNLYIRAAEELILYPSEKELSKKVTELIASRREKKTQLIEAIRAAVDKEIASADQRVAELAVARDKVEMNLQSSKRDLMYAKVLMSADGEAKRDLKNEISQELAAAKSELESLKQLVPTTAKDRDAVPLDHDATEVHHDEYPFDSDAQG
jgi:serine/threonine protein phosphatase PrpC